MERKKKITTSEMKGKREKYKGALKLSLPLSWSKALTDHKGTVVSRPLL